MAALMATLASAVLLTSLRLPPKYGACPVIPEHLWRGAGGPGSGGVGGQVQSHLLCLLPAQPAVMVFYALYYPLPFFIPAPTRHKNKISFPSLLLKVVILVLPH